MAEEPTIRTDKDFDTQMWMKLYRACGWYPNSTVHDLDVLLPHAFLVVTAWSEKEMIGTLTVLSDGANYAMFDDIVVHPDHRRQGIGSTLMRAALHRLGHIDPGAIHLNAIPGVAQFYEQLGFVPSGETPMYWTGSSSLD